LRARIMRARENGEVGLAFLSDHIPASVDRIGE